MPYLTAYQTYYITTPESAADLQLEYLDYTGSFTYAIFRPGSILVGLVNVKDLAPIIFP